MEAPQRHILVVDDEQNLTSLYQIELEAAGYRVSVANNGHDALDEVRIDSPDLVLLDIRIPDMDGLELMSRILAINPDIRIVLNSGYACYRDSFLSWSADAYVLKSSDLGPLLAEIRRLAPAARRTRRAAAEVAVASRIAATIAGS
jgi:two-component system, response regulator, stage 0 sporulation protein F